ncbi:uncharacterized protein LOC111715782 [Eurytemora carolleeae]|uniref:uncharacterized protein LOC111715782 n=1 Tax=Eurytemora carolleeae TaxID=1294199 RepID=UPI000C75C140|nr:uncharacterized protein LOC111715782 [Eurytemora carolleeae]|eukprot:XP_023346918.1 uncharacterized protein LOC111715782 [Eurytemora affinis]
MTTFALAVSCILSVSLVCGTPADLHAVRGTPTDLHIVRKRVSNLPVIPGDEDAQALGLMKHKRWRLEPIKVEQVESYSKKKDDKEEENTKPVAKRSKLPLHNFAKLESSKSEYSNINGRIHTQEENNAKVSENGKILSSFRHYGLGSAEPGQKPHVQAVNELDIPALNLHKKVLENDGEVQQDVHVGQQDEDNILQVAEDLAEYVRVTGDEVGVVSFFMELVENEKMPEAEGLMYLELINSLLVQHPGNKRDEDKEKRFSEEEKAREEEAELILNFSDFIDGKFQAGELSPKVYKQLKDKLMESVLEKAEQDPNFLFDPEEPSF